VKGFYFVHNHNINGMNEDISNNALFEKRFINTDSVLELLRRVYDSPLHKVSLYRAVHEGKLHPVRHGRRLLFPLADIQNWIEGDSSDRTGGAA